MTERKTPKTLQDVRLKLPTLYSESSCAAYDSAFGRVERLTGRRLAQIPADVVDWERLAATIVWAGEFTRGKTPQANRRAFDTFVGRISAAIKKSKSAEGERVIPQDTDNDWQQFVAYVDLAETTMIAPGKRLLPNMASLSVLNLRSRLGHVSLARIDTAVATEALRCLPPDRVQSFRNAVRFLNALIADRGLHGPIAHLLPREPVGPLPTIRDRPMAWSKCSASLRTDLARTVEMGMRAARRTDPFRGQLGQDPIAERRRATRGRKRPVRNKDARAKGFWAALSWLARHAFPDREPVYALASFQELLTHENVSSAIDRFIARAEASEFLLDPTATTSLSTYVSDLLTLARRNGIDEATIYEIEDRHFDLLDDCYGVREMSATREQFVKLVDRDPAVVRAIITGARVLLREAKRLLARKTLSVHERTEALHLYMAATMLAIQLARPLRTRNVHELLSEGDTAQLLAPRRERASAWLDIDRRNVKNRRPLEGRIPAWLWDVISSWLDVGRAEWRKRGRKATKVCEGDADGADLADLDPNDYLFPALTGSAPVSRALINKAWNRGMAHLGLTGLTPHMMRHVAATIYLARHPGDYAVVAALLADKVQTVEKFYSRGDGRAAMEMFAQVLLELDPTLDLKGAA